MRASYELNFKRETVKMIMLQNKTIAQVARETGMNIYTLYSWRKKYGLEFINEALPKMTESQKLRFLEKQIIALKKENEILKMEKSSRNPSGSID